MTILNAPDAGKVPRPIQCRDAPDDATARSALQQVLQSGGTAQHGAETLRAAPIVRTFPQREALTCELRREKQITDQQIDLG